MNDTDGPEHGAPPDDEVLVLDEGSPDTAATPPEPKPADPARKPEAGDEAYGPKVQRRIAQITGQKHRAEAEARRERDARLAMEQELAELRRTAIDATDTALKRDLEAAKAKHRTAYADSDADAVTEASAEMAEIAARRADLAAQKQRTEARPQPTQQSGMSAQTQAYVDENPWFTSDPAARAVAIAEHQRAVADGLKPDTDDYFARITDRVKQRFPEHFEDMIDPEQGEPAPPARRAPPAPPVAAARRTVPGANTQPANKLPSLTPAEADMARRMQMTLKEYAIEKMKLAHTQGKN